MYARLNPGYWAWKDEEGNRHPFVLSCIYRYAGMLSGTGPDGKPTARPLIEFDALSQDGETWKPLHELLASIPWESHVQEQVVHLPEDLGRAA